MLLVESLGRKKGGGVPEISGKGMVWGYGRKSRKKGLYCLTKLCSLWGMVEE